MCELRVIFSYRFIKSFFGVGQLAVKSSAHDGFYGMIRATPFTMYLVAFLWMVNVGYHTCMDHIIHVRCWWRVIFCFRTMNVEPEKQYEMKRTSISKNLHILVPSQFRGCMSYCICWYGWIWWGFILPSFFLPPFKYYKRHFSLETMESLSIHRNLSTCISKDASWLFLSSWTWSHVQTYNLTCDVLFFCWEKSSVGSMLLLVQE